MKIPFNLRFLLFGILPLFVLSYFIVISFSPKGFPDRETQFSFYHRHELNLEAASFAFEELKENFDDAYLHRQFLNYYVLLDDRNRKLLSDEVDKSIGIPTEYYKKLSGDSDPKKSAIGYFGYWKLCLRLKNSISNLQEFSRSDSVKGEIPFINELRGDYWVKVNNSKATIYYYQEWKLGTNDLDLKRKLAIAAFHSKSEEIFVEIIHDEDVKNDSELFPYIRSYLFIKNKTEWLRSIPFQFFKLNDSVVVINAVVIFFVWMIFLVYIDRFKDLRFVFHFICLVVATLSIPLVITMYDTWYFSKHSGYEENIFQENFITGLFEETVKFIFPLLIVLIFKHKLDSPFSVISLFSISALVFATFENMLYFGNYHDLTIVSLRGLYSITSHLCAGTIAGYGYIKWKFANKSFLWIPVTFFIAILIHMMYDVIANSFVFYLNIPFVIIVLFAMVSIFNNALNNSPRFDHTKEAVLNHSGAILIAGLSMVILCEFASNSFRYGAVIGSSTYFQSLLSYGWLILVFASPVSNFKLVKNKWSFIDLGGMKTFDNLSNEIREIQVTPISSNASSYRLKILGTIRANSEKKWFHCLQEETGEYYLVNFKEEGDHLIDHKIILYVLKAEKEIPHAFNAKSYPYLGMVFSSPIINS